MPNVRFELTTYRLQGGCSTSWAKAAYPSRLRRVPCATRVKVLAIYQFAKLGPAGRGSGVSWNSACQHDILAVAFFLVVFFFFWTHLTSDCIRIRKSWNPKLLNFFHTKLSFWVHQCSEIFKRFPKDFQHLSSKLCSKLRLPKIF